MPTIADLYRDTKDRGDARPTFRRIARTVARSGPVLLDGAIIAGQDDGEHWKLDISLERAFAEFARDEEGGFVRHDRSKVPPDESLSHLWGLPLAKDVEADA
jgi:hypothetical protein